MSVKKYARYNHRLKYRSPGASAGAYTSLQNSIETASEKYGEPHYCIVDSDNRLIYFSWPNVRDGVGWKSTRESLDDHNIVSTIEYEDNLISQPTNLSEFEALSWP